jgi:hypothetical protein
VSADTAADTGDFSLQVTPSPLVATVKPGTVTELDLKIRNGGTGSENLKIEPRSFAFDTATGQVKIDDAKVPAFASWLSFSQPTFTALPGQWTTEQLRLSLPANAGFSYSFALVISRQSNPVPTKSGQLIKGSVAVFALINVDRPGATSKLEFTQFTTTKHIYEYLPATFEVRFKNTGNTIVQPTGNIFIGRKSTGAALAVLQANDSQAYILPGTERTLTANWNDGFPAYQTVTVPDGSNKQQLHWDWSRLSHFRIGRFTAQVVAVYSDGQHDVPLQAQVSFWVIPWRAIILLTLIITGLWYLQHWRIKRKTAKAVKRALEAAQKPEAKHNDA